MKQINAWIKREEGFTLIEMSLVLFIISVLLLLFVPNLSGRQTDAANTGEEALVSVLQNQVDMYKMDNDEVPASLTVLKDAKYITDKQFAKADEKYTITDGVVSEKTVTSGP
ncbi:competence protein ComGC [Alkalibacterium subtropicum]|uniref:Competence protein ComGC n=1 Tax=Alkalibacterium subtropicum TaxID=753702 RepID=A0A1I1GS49_9LACT|nr:competence type IV pilus major pilin ComGC [Alkalibacterium subtropicum]SFC14112.1 competence protein ComGC [Alkalibacterium subtropicum]